MSAEQLLQLYYLFTDITGYNRCESSHLIYECEIHVANLKIGQSWTYIFHLSIYFDRSFTQKWVEKGFFCLFFQIDPHAYKKNVKILLAE